MVNVGQKCNLSGDLLANVTTGGQSGTFAYYMYYDGINFLIPTLSPRCGGWWARDSGFTLTGTLAD